MLGQSVDAWKAATACSGLDLETLASISEIERRELSGWLLIARGWLLLRLEGCSATALPGVAEPAVLEPIRLACPEDALARITAGVSQ